jgi:hypothetical protein
VLFAPYVYEYNLTLEQQFGKNWASMISYVGNARLLLHDINAPKYVVGAANTPTGINARRPYEPTTGLFGAINLYDPAENTNYNSLQVTLRGNGGKHGSILASYVWSKDLNYAAPFVDGSDIRKNYGPVDEDIRNRFVVSYLYPFPNVKVWGVVGKEVLSGWQINGVTALTSGSPITVTSGIDTNLDGTVNDRVDIIDNP